MASRSYRLPSPYERTPLRRRVSGWALAIGLELLLVFLLLGLGIRTVDMAPTKSGPVMIDIGPRDDDQAQPQPANPERKPRTPPVIPPITSPIPPIISALTPPPATPPPQRPPDFIEMSPADMAAGDIATLPKSGRSAGDSQVVGKGPNGEDLYAAEWVREPTDAEMNAYLPRNPRSGVGLVACRTVAGNRVEDCVELGNVPQGTHLASTLRQAAWQFRVRPPRKGGKALVGGWVQILYEFTVTSKESGE